MYYEVESEEIKPAAEEPANLRRAEKVFPLYSVVYIVGLIAVLLAQVATDGADDLFTGGVKSVYLAGFVKQFFYAGEYWRILTGAVMHGGLIHLAFNCYALYVLGKLVEVLSNRAHLAIVFLLAAIGGGVLSLVFLPDVPSIGASGGIVGFLGYLTAYGFKRRKLLSNEFLKSMIFNIVFIGFVGVFVMSNIDNFGHLGGLVTGAIYGAIQIPSDIYKDPRETNQIIKIFGYAALGIFLLTCAFTIFILLMNRGLVL